MLSSLVLEKLLHASDTRKSRGKVKGKKTEPEKRATHFCVRGQEMREWSGKCWHMFIFIFFFCMPLSFFIYFLFFPTRISLVFSPRPTILLANSTKNCQRCCRLTLFSH